MLKDPCARVLRTRALPSRPNAVHAGAEQVRYAAARVWHAATLQNSKSKHITDVIELKTILLSISLFVPVNISLYIRMFMGNFVILFNGSSLEYGKPGIIIRSKNRVPERLNGKKIVLIF